LSSQDIFNQRKPKLFNLSVRQIRKKNISDRLSPEQVLQSILQNVQVGGNLTTGDINQILNLLVIVKQPDSFKPTGIPHNLPRSGTIKFVGRAEALENLHQMVQHNNQVVIAAIEGVGGVGKTELATQYALLHLLLLTYPGGICWLRARDEDVGIQILNFIDYFNRTMAKPFKWTDKGKVLAV
jgi:hypothetical protein